MIHIMGQQRGRNRAVKSSVKTHIDKAEQVIGGKELETAKDAVKRASVALDKAAQKSIIHPNNAARHKSRLMKKLNAAFPASETTLVS